MSKTSENGGLDAIVKGGLHTSHVSPQLPGQERKATVYDLRHERPELYSALFRATQHDTKRKLLHGLHMNNGTALYDHLEATGNVSRRQVKSHVYDLDDAGIVTRSGNPVVVSFVDTDVALLASDTLSLTDPL